MEVKQSEMTQEIWDDWGALIRNQECAECGAGLTIHTVPETEAMALGCSADHNHSGFRQRTCLTEEFRRGKEVYPTVKDRIEAKMLVNTDTKRAMQLLALRFPDAIKDAPTAALFINDCMRLGLDPLIQPAEAVPVAFKTKDKAGKEKYTVAMIITEDGYLSMAARGCQDEYDGPPATMPLLDYLMQKHERRPLEELEKMASRIAKELSDDAKAFVWVALGKRRSATEINPVYGYFTQADWNDAKTKKLPAAKRPGNQARVRAVKEWVRETFPDAREKMLEYTAELERRTGGMPEIKEWIDTEYRILDIPDKKPALISPPGQKDIGAAKAPRTHAGKQADNKVGESAKRTQTPRVAGTGTEKPAAAASEADDHTLLSDTEASEMSIGREASGEGEVGRIPIDWDWFWETLKQIKWKEDTCKTWMASHLQVDTEGDLQEIIPRLPRDKAELLFRELQTRADGRQPELL